jgi:hypothetical protein
VIVFEAVLIGCLMAKAAWEFGRFAYDVIEWLREEASATSLAGRLAPFRATIHIAWLRLLSGSTRSGGPG